MTQTSIENLFQSIDTIIDARMANLPFDQTLECEIIKPDSETKNKYLIKYQASTFFAYSQNGAIYSPGDIVYVQIPQGDFTQDKFILSKRFILDNTNAKKMPFLSFVKNANLVNNAISTREYIIQTSSDEKEKTSITKPITNFYGDRFGAGYTKIGIKFAVKADITEKLLSGKYGVRLVVKGFDQTKTYLSGQAAVAENSTIYDTRVFDFPMKEMIGSSMYNTMGYNNQEKVFDITNFIIDSVQFEFYEDGDFFVASGTDTLEIQKKNLLDIQSQYEKDLISITETLKAFNISNALKDELKIEQEEIKNKIELIKNKIEQNAVPAKKYKIYFTNLQLFLGYSYSEFENSNYKVFLYTTDGLQYNNEWNSKDLKIRFVEIVDKINLNVLDNVVAGSSAYQIYWERYDSTETKISNYSNLISYVLFSNIKKIETTYPLMTTRGILTQSFVVTIKDNATGKSYTSNKLLFTSSAYLTNSELLDVFSSKEYFVIDRNGYVFLNGGANGGTPSGGVTISKGYITDSTLNNITLTGTNTGTIQFAKNYTTNGNIYTNLQRIQTAITALGGNYTIV